MMEYRHYITSIEPIDEVKNDRKFKEKYKEKNINKSTNDFETIFQKEVDNYFENEARLNQKKDLQNQKAYIELLKNKYILYHNIKNDNDEITKSK